MKITLYRIIACFALIAAVSLGALQVYRMRLTGERPDMGMILLIGAT